MSQTLKENTVAIVKATVPALNAHGLDIVHEMYSRMFQNSEIRDLFNQSHHGDASSQPRALAGAILAYAGNIDNLGALAPAVERIAQKHVGLQILPEHYPHVGEALLGAIKAVLGDAATDEVLEAWGEAYWFLANILMARENRIYDEQKVADGGWNGWRDFRIEEIIRESSTISSFVLRPVDGGPVMEHKPGQYLTFWFEIDNQAPIKRNYSISSATNGKTYRISVKRSRVVQPRAGFTIRQALVPSSRWQRQQVNSSSPNSRPARLSCYLAAWGLRQWSLCSKPLPINIPHFQRNIFTGHITVRPTRCAIMYVRLRLRAAIFV